MPSLSSTTRHGSRLVLFVCLGCAVAHPGTESMLALARSCPCDCPELVWAVRSPSRAEWEDWAAEGAEAFTDVSAVPWMVRPWDPESKEPHHVQCRKCCRRITVVPADLVAAASRHPDDPTDELFLRANVSVGGQVFYRLNSSATRQSDRDRRAKCVRTSSPPELSPYGLLLLSEENQGKAYVCFRLGDDAGRLLFRHRDRLRDRLRVVTLPTSAEPQRLRDLIPTQLLDLLVPFGHWLLSETEGKVNVDGSQVSITFNRAGRFEVPAELQERLEPTLEDLTPTAITVPTGTFRVSPGPEADMMRRWMSERALA